jgi:hypothetical protein
MEQLHVDLTPFAGQTIQLRLRYATDLAFRGHADVQRAKAGNTIGQIMVQPAQAVE